MSKSRAQAYLISFQIAPRIQPCQASARSPLPLTGETWFKPRKLTFQTIKERPVLNS